MTNPAAGLTEAQKQAVREHAASLYDKSERELRLAARLRDGKSDQILEEEFALAAALVKFLEETVVRRIKSALDTRLNDALCEMQPGWDDSIVGFNEAWDIVSKYLKERLAVEG